MVRPLEHLSPARIDGAVPAWRARVDSQTWRDACESLARGGGRLGALWATDERDRAGGFALHALLVAYEGLVCLELGVEDREYPDLTDIFPSANRMQRAIRDLHGLDAGADRRPWLVHGSAPYEFVAVEGDGVHEIPV